MTVESFNIGYQNAHVYEEMLPPHYFGGTEDIDLIRDLMARHYGQPPEAGKLRVLDLGCGPGRITQVLAPYAAGLHGTDKSAGMVELFRQRFPCARATHGDTEYIVHRLLEEDGPGSYDVIGSFWSMSYPLLECFEETSAEGVVTVGDLAAGTARAAAIVDGVVSLLAPGGRLLMLFFDAETAEQRLVTRLWERVAPFPGTGRGFTWELLVNGLLAAERNGRGRLTVTRLSGVVLTENARQARDWFRIGHLNTFAALVNDPAVLVEIDTFVARHQLPDGRVLLPSGVHVVDFVADPDLRNDLP